MNDFKKFIQEQGIYSILDNENFQKESQVNQILLIIAEKGKITQSEVTSELQNRCYLVTNVTDVTLKKLNDKKEVLQNFSGNKGNKGTRVTSESSLRSSVKTVFNRLVKQDLLNVDKSGKEYLYSLKVTTEQNVTFIVKKWIDDKRKLEIRENKKGQLTKTYYAFDDYFKFDIDVILSNYNSKKFFAEVDIIKLSKIDPDIAELLLETPVDILDIAKMVLKEYLERYGVNEEPNIILTNVPKSSRRNITNIRAKDLDKVINVIGEIRSRGKSNLQITSINYECPSCGTKQNIIQKTNKQTHPFNCKGCGFKRKFIEQKMEKEDFLKLTIYDLYENISNNEVPEELNIYLQKDLYGFSYLKEGDKVELTGICSSDEKTDSKGNKMLFQEKIFRGYGCKKLDNSFTDDLITKEDEKYFEVIKSNPIEFHQKVLFNDLHNVDFPAMVASICMYGNHNLLFAGKPGTGKTEITKRITQIALKGKFANCVTSSTSGILGSVTKNEFTGKYTLDGGVFRPVHPNGIVVLDEINRDSQGELQKAILGVMNDQRININKANTRIDEPCKVSVWCNANPVKENTNLKAHEIFNVIEPLYDRFDLVVFYDNELDWEDITTVEKLLSDKKTELDVKHKDLVILKKYQMKAEQIQVKLEESDYKKISLLMKEILPHFEEKLSYRKLKTVTSLLTSICKIHHRDRTIQEDYKMLTDIFMKVKNQRQSYKIKYMEGDY
jgi:DNA replicative helicase MCM subunit Mcm2 (Cdc46/Mcm family)